MKKIRTFLQKKRNSEIKENYPDNIFKYQFDIQESDEDNRFVFGWANVAVRADGEQIEDYQEDIIDIDDLEKAAYEFVLKYRMGGEMHEKSDVAVLIESIVFTKEKMRRLGIPEGTLPEGWFIGFKVNDIEVWEKIKNGTYTMFSIEGSGTRIPV